MRHFLVTVIERDDVSIGWCNKKVIHFRIIIRSYQEQTGSSNRPWISRQTGPFSSSVTGTRRYPGQIFKYSPPSLAKGSWAPPYSTPSFPVLVFVTLSLVLPSLPSLSASEMTYSILCRVGR